MIAQLDVVEIAKGTDYSLVGVLLVAIGALCYIAVKGIKTLCQWTAREVIVPSRDRLFNHLERTSNAMEGLDESMRTLRNVPESLVRIEGKVNHLGDRVDQIDDHLERQK